MDKAWTVTVYKRDARCKLGERKVAKYPFVGMDREGLERELRELTAQLYPKKDGWRFDVQPRYVTVKNLMTGELVQIEAEQRGGPCDPSMERYWTM